MWEATNLGGEDLLWAATGFYGGIGGEREGVCGALSGAAVYLGLRHRVPLNDRDRADTARKASREQTRQVVDSFKAEQGNIICARLLGIDFSDAAAVQRFRDSGDWMRRCIPLVQNVITRLYVVETE